MASNKDIVASMDYPEDTLKLHCVEFMRLQGKTSANDRLEVLRVKILGEVIDRILEGNRNIANLYNKRISEGYPMIHIDASRMVPDTVLESLCKDIVRYINQKTSNKLYGVG